MDKGSLGAVMAIAAIAVGAVSATLLTILPASVCYVVWDVLRWVWVFGIFIGFASGCVAWRAHRTIALICIVLAIILFAAGALLPALRPAMEG